MPDPFYAEVKQEQIGLYQYFFQQVLRAVDIANNTAWARAKPYDRSRLAADDETMDGIIGGEAARAGLSPSLLQIMVNQFFFADPYMRETHKEKWVTRVLHREPIDDFPDGWSVRRALEKMNMR
jgi:hypothetical protein